MKIFIRIVLLFVFSAFTANAALVNKIKVSGNYRIETETIKSLLAIKSGEKYDDDKVDNSLKNLFASDLFADVNITLKKSTLLVDVVENPKINKVVFEGNKRIKEDDLSREISLQPRSTFTKTKLKNDINRIVDSYVIRGRYATKVTPRMVKKSQNRIDLIFEIDEGKQAKINKIIFVGNKNFSDNKLKNAISSSETKWHSFLSNNDQYNPHKIDYDRELLTRFYKNRGFAKFKVLSSITNISQDRSEFYITFTIEEGNKYRFGNFTFDGKLKNMNKADLIKIISKLKGNFYAIDDIEHSIENIRNLYNDQGYAFVDVEPVEHFNQRNQIIDINFVITEGRQVYLNSINIAGNRKTKEHVIRREFLVEEGDSFSATKILQSRHRVNALDFFKSVDIQKRSSDLPSRFDIDVVVEEKSTAGINLAGGYDTSKGIVGHIGLTENNFLGNGQYLNIGLSKASKNTDFNLSFVEPYFLDSKASLGIDIFKYSAHRDVKHSRDFSVQSKGISLRTMYSINDNLSHRVSWNLKNSKISSLPNDVPIYITKQKGKIKLSSISHKLTYDIRDIKSSVESGFIGYIEQEYAGIGGNVKYIRNEIKSGYYIPISQDGTVLSFEGSIGSIQGFGGQKIRIVDKFQLGGDVMRGFALEGIGPRAKIYDKTANKYLDSNNKGIALGGKHYYTATTELKFPLGNSKELGTYGLLFSDIGNVFDADIPQNQKKLYYHKKSLRSSVGIGVGINTPFGPMKMTYALPISKQKFDRIERFYVSFSTSKF